MQARGLPYRLAGDCQAQVLMTERRFPARALSLGSLLLALMQAASLAEHATIPVAPLATYGKLDRAGVTVSGISSGAFFAHQFHVAYSGLVKGAGMVAGGLYACAEQVDDVVLRTRLPASRRASPRRSRSAPSSGAPASRCRSGAFRTNPTPADRARRHSPRVMGGLGFHPLSSTGRATSSRRSRRRAAPSPVASSTSSPAATG